MDLRFLVTTLVLSLTLGCSTAIEDWRGVGLVCHGSECPPQSQVVGAVEFFVAASPEGFLVAETLDVHWYDADTAPFQPGVLAYTASPSEVHVTNQRLLIHELVHIGLWRSTGDPDSNHEASPGPWTSEMNEEIRSIELALEEEQASVLECLELLSKP